jgi:hypothetical protein
MGRGTYLEGVLAGQIFGDLDGIARIYVKMFFDDLRKQCRLPKDEDGCSETTNCEHCWIRILCKMPLTLIDNAILDTVMDLIKIDAQWGDQQDQSASSSCMGTDGRT